jgi:septal ring factor EnvC (AmiA/AmiB activator)
LLTNSPQNQSELLSVVQAELSVLQDRLASVTHDLETTTAELELARERVSDLEDRLDQELVQARQAQQARIFDFSFCSYCCYLSLSSWWC